MTGRWRAAEVVEVVPGLCVYFAELEGGEVWNVREADYPHLALGMLLEFELLGNDRLGAVREAGPRREPEPWPRRPTA
jgi:hypothetical protein